MLFAIQLYLYPPLEGEKLASIRVLSFEKSSHTGYSILTDSFASGSADFIEIAKTEETMVDTMPTNRHKERIFRIDTRMIKIKRRII